MYLSSQIHDLRIFKMSHSCTAAISMYLIKGETKLKNFVADKVF